MENIEKIKEILSKVFCFTEMQENDANERGQLVRNVEDIKFLLSSKGITREEIQNFEVESKPKYSSKKLFLAIKNAQDKGFLCLRIWIDILRQKDMDMIKEMGFFVHMTGCGSTSWDEIFFSEEAYLRNEISDFQNMFGSFKQIAHLI